MGFNSGFKGLSASIYLFCLKDRKHSICLNNHVQLQTTESGPYIGDGLFSMWRKSWGRRKSWLYRHNNEARPVVNLNVYGVSTINTVSSRFRGTEGNFAAGKKRQKLAVHAAYNVQRHMLCTTCKGTCCVQRAKAHVVYNVQRHMLCTTCKGTLDFLISSFRRVLNVAIFLLGDSPASEFHVATFRNPLSFPSS